MLKEHATVFRRLMIFADLCFAVAAFLTAYFMRQGAAGGLKPLGAYLWLLPSLLLILWGLLHVFGMYSSFRIKRVPEVLMIIAKVIAVGFLLFGNYIYLFHVGDVSRSFILLIFFWLTIFLVSEKLALIYFFKELRRRGFNFRNVLIVGSGPRAQNFMARLDQHREFGLKIIGVVDAPPEAVGLEVAGHKIIGTFQDIPEFLRQNSVDHVVFIVPRSLLGQIEEPILHCETVGVTVSVAVDLFDLQFTAGKEGSILGLPLITFESTSDKIWQLLVKRAMDMASAVILLVILFPVYLFIAIVIKLTSPGPVYFVQERSGLQGRRFKLYKFRTMVQDAEAKLKDLMAHNEMKGPAFKMKNDPRVTPFGRFLRKTSLDEIPQLWNVLKGQMSLVGARPPLPSEVEKYDHWHRRRLSMRPGLTCLWQISGRNNIIDFDEWMRLDLQYIDHWSLALDFKILFMTIPAVLKGTGAK